MHPFPHLYTVSAAATATGAVALDSPGLATLESYGPA